MKSLLIALFTGISAIALATAQTPADSAKVYFRLGHRHYDSSFNNNETRMQPFLDAVKRHDAASDIERISVRSYASPDGTTAANQRLSQNRCKAITDYIVEETGIAPTLIQSEAEGIAWDELLRMVKADSNVPCRDEVIEVIESTPVWVLDAEGKVVGSRKKSLMDLHGGAPYRWLYTNIFPSLRNAVAVALYTTAPTDIPQHQTLATLKPTPSDESTPYQDEPAPAEAPYTSPTPLEETAPETPIATPTPLPADPIHRLAIKTNLVYDALLMPSLEVEWRFNDRWTVNFEADIAWWKNDSRHKYYQLMMYSPEARYWFKNINGRPWHGHYVGAFAGGGKYDLENGGRGYLGEGYFAGFSYGFMFPISRNLSFEAGIGVGYLYTRYKEYLPIDGHYVYQQTSRTNYIGPLKLKFTLVWHLWDINKPKNRKGATL